MSSLLFTENYIVDYIQKNTPRSTSQPLTVLEMLRRDNYINASYANRLHEEKLRKQIQATHEEIRKLERKLTQAIIGTAQTLPETNLLPMPETNCSTTHTSEQSLTYIPNFFPRPPLHNLSGQAPTAPINMELQEQFSTASTNPRHQDALASNSKSAQ